LETFPELVAGTDKRVYYGTNWEYNKECYEMVKVIADSTCDLSKELVEKYNISILPLYIHLGEEEYIDGKITPEEIYKWSDSTGSTPTTSAPSVADAMEIMKPYVDAGQDIIFFTISEDMSTTANVIRMAVDELNWQEHTEVIDSENLSTGIGLMVIRAAIMATEGKTLIEISNEIKSIRPKVRASFVVDTLVYLHRGGRCSATAKLFGTMLKLKPRIVVENGKMDAAKKYRGKMNRVILEYVKDMEPALLNACEDRVFITHSGCDQEIIQAVKKYLEELSVFKEILITRAGCVVSSHCGPGTLGVLFIEK
jgi:DegV family protein with EDD domain